MEDPISKLHVHPVYTQYGATEDGVIIRVGKRAPMKSNNSVGYLRVSLSIHGKTKMVLNHRFLYEAYHKLTLSKEHEVDHIDGNRHNNSIHNLKALTTAEHRRKTAADNPFVGRRVGISLGKEIASEFTATSNVQVFSSSKEASRILGVSRRGIIDCLRGRREQAQGYRFSYTGKHSQDLPNEVWRPIDGVEVSNHGRVKTSHGVKTFGYKTIQGYYTTTVNYKGLLVHVLVCTAFHGPRPSSDHTVDHIDRVRDNNKAENLRWATHSEQVYNRSMA